MSEVVFEQFKVAAEHFLVLFYGLQFISVIQQLIKLGQVIGSSTVDLAASAREILLVMD